jgi:hypothetical protein
MALRSAIHPRSPISPTDWSPQETLGQGTASEEHRSRNISDATLDGWFATSHASHSLTSSSDIPQQEPFSLWSHHLVDLAPVVPTHNSRSRSVDELGLYPSPNSSLVPVKDKVAQVQAQTQSRSQSNMLPRKPKSKESKKSKGSKLASGSSSGSLSRRNSAPLLGSFDSKSKKPVARVAPIDTSSGSYNRPGITPTNLRLTSATGQLSTFGTVYIPPSDSTFR